jgi:leader peptidase (prepilin peptidase)/N-methyltransferase
MNVISFLAANPNTYLMVVMIISLFIGSFLNVVIYRLPRIIEQSWREECRQYLGLKPLIEKSLSLSLPFSYCPQCNAPIRPWHNIPVISYLLLQGKCAECKKPISWRYPLVEIITCILSLYIAWKFGVSWQAMSALLFTWIIIVLTFIDLDYYILPDQLTFLLLWIGLVSSLLNLFCTPQEAIIGGMTGYLIFAIIQWIFKLITNKDGMGQGDFKFLAAMGAFFGWRMLPFIILLASLSGIIFTFSQMIIKGDYKSHPLPFGPYLALAGWCTLLAGNEIMQYYFDG